MKIERRQFEPVFKRLRRSIVERDGKRCLKCASSLPLEVHHVEGYKQNNTETLVTLCYLCHGLAPMGHDEFQEWLEVGDSGIEVLQKRLRENQVGAFEAEIVEQFCATLVELGLEFHSSKLRRGRAHKKRIEGRCEGSKPYGHYPGEASILAKIHKMRATGMYCHDIANQLTSEGLYARSGKAWHKGSIAQLLRRDAKQNVKSRTSNLFQDAQSEEPIQTSRLGRALENSIAEGKRNVG